MAHAYDGRRTLARTPERAQPQCLPAPAFVNNKVKAQGSTRRDFSLKLNPERCALAHYRAFHPDFSAVILLYYALGQTQSKPPAALLRGEPGAENVADVLLPDAFSRVGYLDNGLCLGLLNVQNYTSGAASHSVDGVLAQVFNHPFEERGVQVYDDVVGGKLLAHLDRLAGPAVHIVDDVVHYFVQA